MDFFRPVANQVLNAMPKPFAVLVAFGVMAVVVGASHYHQVLCAVVVFLAIDVMYNFILGDRATKLLRHYKNMLADVAVLSGVRMIGHKQMNISVAPFTPTAPVWISWPCPIPFWLSNSHSGTNSMLLEGRSQL